MTVITRAGSVLVDDVAKAKEKLWQLDRIDRAILDKRDRLPLALHAKKQAQPRFAQLPDIRLFNRIERSHERVTEVVTLECRFHAVELRSQFGLIFAIELNEEDRCRMTLQESHLPRQF